MTNIIGIDLGTTFSAVARLDDNGKPQIVPNADGDRITASAIWFPEGEEDRSIVGAEALNARETEPDRVVVKVKRGMGDPNYKVNVDGKDWTAQELSALILSKLRQDTEEATGALDEVVISVPAYFDEVRRKATMDAGAIAGLNVVGIVNEPTAAALFYAQTQEVHGKVLVYDLGGGTFDVTVMEVRGRDIEILCSGGDHRLGGVDFDNAIIDLLASAYEKDKGQALPKDDQARKVLLNAAETVKKGLGKRDVVKQMVNGPAGSSRLEISRAQFEEAISALVTKSQMLVESTLDEINLAPGDINKVLLVGGSCRVPLVRERLTRLFGFEPSVEVNVDEAVALGAAIQAGLKVERSDVEKMPETMANGIRSLKLTDVANHSYGTIALTADAVTQRTIEENSIIIQKNTALPCSETEIYATVADGQDSIRIRITQGEDSDPDFVTIIHEEEMELPPNRAAGRPIRVTYSYDDNQRMHCVFADEDSGRSREIVLTARSHGGFDAQAIDTSKAALNEFIIE